VRKRRRQSDLPPEGLWVSPEGKMIPVAEHLLAIKEHPRRFGLMDSTRRADMDGLLRVAQYMILFNWMRFRYLDGVYHFEVGQISRHMKRIKRVLRAARARREEEMTISQAIPPKEYAGTVGDFRAGFMPSCLFCVPISRNAWRFTGGEEGGDAENH
jgi:hypothetical protein